MKFHKWFLSLALSIPVLAYGISAAKPVTIEYTVWWKGPCTEDAIRQFEKTYPNIKVKLMVLSDYFPKLLTMQAGGAPPDVVDFQTWDVYTLGDPGLLEDINKYVKRDKYALTDFVPGYIDMYTYKGQLIGLPWGYNTHGLAYSTAMFEQNGLPFPIPRNGRDHLDWTDFLDMCRKMTKDTNGDGRADTWGWGEDQFWLYPNWVCQNGGGFISPDLSKVLVTGENTIAALQFQADLWNKYKYVAPGYYVSDFPKGKIGMCLGGGWMFPDWRKVKNFSFDIAPMFWEKKPYANMIAQGVGIMKRSRNKEAAWTFVKWLCSSEGQKVLHREPNFMPARLSVAKGEIFMNATPPKHNEYLIQEALKGRVEAFPNVQPTRVMDAFKTEFYRIMQGKTSAKEGMHRAAPVMQRALDDWNKRRRR